MRCLHKLVFYILMDYLTLQFQRKETQYIRVSNQAQFICIIKMKICDMVSSNYRNSSEDFRFVRNFSVIILKEIGRIFPRRNVVLKLLAQRNWCGGNDKIVVTAQLQPNMKLVYLDNWQDHPPTTHTQTFRPLPDNLGSLFSVYNLILTQVDEICKKNGVPYIFFIDHFQTTQEADFWYTTLF